MSKKVNSSVRKRCWFLVLYCSVKELEDILFRFSPRVSHYAFIVHDKDVYLEDCIDLDTNEYKYHKGDIEKVHIHLLIDFYDAHTFTAVKRIFTTSTDNPRCEPVSDRVQCYRYLTHKDNPEKFQYVKTDIISDDVNYYEKLCIVGEKKDTDNIAMEIIEDLLRGISPRLLVQRYGRDFVIHMSQYKACADEIRMFELLRKVHSDNEKLLEKVELKQVHNDDNPFE